VCQALQTQVAAAVVVRLSMIILMVALAALAL
jgi:hypothetical protein